MYRRRIYHSAAFVALLIVVQLLLSNGTAHAMRCLSCPWCTFAVHDTLEYKNGTWMLVDLNMQVKLSGEVIANIKHLEKRDKVEVKKLVGLIVLSERKGKTPVVTAFVPAKWDDLGSYTGKTDAPSAKETLANFEYYQKKKK